MLKRRKSAIGIGGFGVSLSDDRWPVSRQRQSESGRPQVAICDLLGSIPTRSQDAVAPTVTKQAEMARKSRAEQRIEESQDDELNRGIEKSQKRHIHP